MEVKYNKVTSKEEIIAYIRSMDIEDIRNNGKKLVIPMVEKEIMKLIVRELKKLGIYHKIDIVVVRDVKEFYKKSFH